tara:strand:- start:587 stop:841 length:255 start_codon:yes stop_codon:yes gene_type:complete
MIMPGSKHIIEAKTVTGSRPEVAGVTYFNADSIVVACCFSARGKMYLPSISQKTSHQKQRARKSWQVCHFYSAFFAVPLLPKRK